MAGPEFVPSVFVMIVLICGSLLLACVALSAVLVAGGGGRRKAVDRGGPWAPGARRPGFGLRRLVSATICGSASGRWGSTTKCPRLALVSAWPSLDCAVATVLPD